MPANVSAWDFRREMTENLARVRYSGERLVITQHGKPAAVLISVDDAQLLEALEEQALTAQLHERLEAYEAEGQPSRNWRERRAERLQR